MRKLTIYVIPFVLVVTLFAVTLHAQQKVRMGSMLVALNLPLFVAIDKGFFGEETIDLDLTYMASGAVIIPAVMGGSLEIGFSAYLPALVANAQGLDFKIIASSGNENSMGKPDPAFGYGGHGTTLVRAELPINSAKGLEGKKIAIPALYTIDWLMISAWMEKNGADPRKVHWVELPPPRQGAALAAGQVDAMMGIEPYTTMLKEQGVARVISYTLTEVRPNMIIAGYGAAGRFIEKNDTIIKKWVRAHKKGINFIEANREEAGKVLSKYTKVPLELISRMTWPSYKTELDPGEFQWLADMANKYGIIKKKVDASQFIYETAR